MPATTQSDADDTTQPATTQQVFTGQDVFNAALKFEQHSLRDAYDQVGQRDAKWDAPSHAFLDRLAYFFAASSVGNFYMPKIDISRQSLMALADAAMQAGCKDPLVRYGRAAVLKDPVEERISPEYTSEINAVEPALMNSHYPALRKLYLLDHYSQSTTVRHSPKFAARIAQKQCDEWMKMLADPVADPIELRFKTLDTQTRMSNLAPDVRETFMKSLEAAKEVDPWLKNMILGMGDIAIASELLQKANDTDPQSREQTVVAYYQKAQDQFESAYSVEPDYPESLERLIWVSVYVPQRRSSPEQWFDRAMLAQPDYMHAWTSYLVSLRPAFGGSAEQMRQLAQRAAETKQYDSPIPAFFFEGMRGIAEITDRDFSFLQQQDTWPTAKAVCDGYLQKLPPSMNADTLQSEELAFAYRCGQYKAALDLANWLGKRVNLASLAGYDVSLDELVLVSQAMVSDQGGAIRDALNAEKGGRFAAASEAFAAIAKAVPADHPAHEYALHQQTHCTVERDLAAGKKVTLPTSGPTDMSLWRGDVSDWKMTDAGLEVVGPHDHDPTLHYAGAVPATSRISVEWQYATQPPANGQPAFAITFSNVGKQYGDMLGVTAFPLTGYMQAETRTFTVKGAVAKHVKLTPSQWHTTVIERHAKACTITYYFDGEKEATSPSIDWLGYGQPTVGFVAETSVNGALIRIRNVTVEPIDEE